jgi:poly-gamma-glutamate synthesis protein (capsule biosynthesis protein)
VAEARAEGTDSVVVLVHWGFEYEYYPDPHFMVLARRIVAAGADLVVGSGPHVAQPAEICHVNRPEEVPGIGTCSLRTADGQPRTAAVLYSLGNFGTIMATVPCQVGLVATVSLDPDVTGLGWSAVATVEDPPWVRPLDDLLDDPELAAEWARLDGHLGSDWRR